MHNVAAPSKQTRDRERIRVKRADRVVYQLHPPSAATDKRKIRMERPLHAESVIIEIIVVILKCNKVKNKRRETKNKI